MRPADLLAIAVPTAPRPATTPASAEDADAFARAMESESGRALPEQDPRCGVVPGQAQAADRGVRGDRPDDGPAFVRPEGGQRPDRAAMGEWRGFLQGLRDLGLLAGPARQDGEAAAGKLTLTTALQAEAATSAPKPAPASVESEAFRAALEALSAAINAAVQDPAANPAQPGQLPAAVQTALDAAVAAAPALLQPRVQAFGERLTQRLAMMLGGETGERAGEAGQGEAIRAAAAAAAADPNRPARSVAQAVLAALGQAGQVQTPVIPDMERRAARAETASATLTPEPQAQAPAAAPTAGPAPTAQAGASDARASATPSPVEAAAEAAAEPTVAAPAAETTADPEATGPAATSAGSGASSAAHAATVAATRGAPELVAQLAATIVRKLEGRTTRFNMELNPAEMGRVDVKLSIDKDGRVAAQMAFDNPVAAADMRGRADELRRQLEQAGFQVAGEDLTFAERKKGSAFDRHARPEIDPDAARERAFREGERSARLAEDAGRLANRAIIGLDMRV